MDSTDAAILRALNWHPRHPVDAAREPLGLWDIARQLGVHGNTVKRRLQDLEKAGILTGVGVFPNARDIGLYVTGCYLEFDDPQAAAAAEVTLVAENRPGVVMRVDGAVGANVAVQAEAEVQPAMEALAARLGADRIRLTTPRYWEPGGLTELERRVVWALMTNAFATPPELGAELGVTAKTVRRCIAALRGKQAFIVVPFISFLDVTGMHPIVIDVETGGDVAAMHRVLRAYPDLFMGGTPDAVTLTFTGFVQTAREQEELVAGIRSVEGVTSVRPRVLMGWKWTGVPDAVTSASDGLTRLAEWDDVADQMTM